MPGIDVNDIHSQLNPTSVDRIVPVDSLEAIQAAIAAAQDERKSISIAGGRHAMGGQQFGSGTILWIRYRWTAYSNSMPQQA